MLDDEVRADLDGVSDVIGATPEPLRVAGRERWAPVLGLARWLEDFHAPGMEDATRGDDASMSFSARAFKKEMALADTRENSTIAESIRGCDLRMNRIRT